MLTTSNGTNTRKPHAALNPMPINKLRNVSIKESFQLNESAPGLEHGQPWNCCSSFDHDQMNHGGTEARRKTRKSWRFHLCIAIRAKSFQAHKIFLAAKRC